MDTRQTAAAYDKLASHWAGPSGPRENGIVQHECALKFLRNPGTAIDIGCGSSGRIISLLQARGFAVEGLDFSGRMLVLAKQKHPNITFHHADICEWVFPKKYDFISAWDSIWHVPLNQQESVLEKLCVGLNPRGVLIFTNAAVDTPAELTNPFQGQPLYHAALGASPLLRLIDKCGCVCRHLEQDQFPEGHLYLIVQKL